VVTVPAQRETRGETFGSRLLCWFQHNRRSFIWREKPDGWLVLVSEILLKKTRASRVDSFVRGFMEKYPNPKTLALADQDKLEHDLAPLGLQRQRAAHMHALARTLVEEFNGEIPDTEEELRTLPGLGEYSRNAVRCFAFGERLPIVDANVVRVLARVFRPHCSRAEPRRSPEMWEIAWALLPENASSAVHHNLALLDLGALVCLPRKPRCRCCPLLEVCMTGGDLMHRPTCSGAEPTRSS